GAAGLRRVGRGRRGGRGPAGPPGAGRPARRHPHRRAGRGRVAGTQGLGAAGPARGTVRLGGRRAGPRRQPVHAVRRGAQGSAAELVSGGARPGRGAGLRGLLRRAGTARRHRRARCLRRGHGREPRQRRPGHPRAGVAVAL
ncbi:MAG: D-aminoacyl-tRNA deacylase, partial [uncultured Nocardioidaceae bacterium]